MLLEVKGIAVRHFAATLQKFWCRGWVQTLKNTLFLVYFHLFSVSANMAKNGQISHFLRLCLDGMRGAFDKTANLKLLIHVRTLSLSGIWAVLTIFG